MSESRAFHVYALLSPDDGLVHYVGKTKDVAQRFRSHVQGAQRVATREGRGPKNRRERWLWELALEGHEPLLATLEEIPVADRGAAAYEAADREALALEAAWVGRLRNAGHPLTSAEDNAGAQSRLLEHATERGRNLALSPRTNHEA